MRGSVLDWRSSGGKKSLKTSHNYHASQVTGKIANSKRVFVFQGIFHPRLFVRTDIFVTVEQMV